MRTIRAENLLALSACLLRCASANAQDTTKTPLSTPGALRTTPGVAYIIDRSPMATSAEAQAGTANHLYAKLLYNVKAPTIAGLSARITDLIAKVAPQNHEAALDPDLRDFYRFLSRKTPENISLGEELAQILTVSLRALDDKSLALESLRYNALLTYLASQADWEKHPLRREAFAAEQQARWIDKQNSFATNLIYSSAKQRIDILGQYLTGTRAGYGAGLHYALDGFKAPPEPRKAVAKRFGLFVGDAADARILRRIGASKEISELQETIAASEEAVNGAALAQYIRATHFGIGGHFQHRGGVGDYYEAAVSESGMRPFKRGSQTLAFYYGVGLRYQWFEAADAGGSAKDYGSSLVLAFQDNAPHLNPDNTTNLGRWHKRLGVEFAPGNALIPRAYEALFLRLRDRGAGEYTILLGRETNGQGFIGFNLSTYFAR